MRIISGSHKGKQLRAPKNLPVRPTTDAAKEALFNILNNDIYFDEVSVLDLFSGTGNISYEFAARGSQSVTAVDQNNNCVRFIKKTADSLDFNIDVFKDDCVQFVKRAHRTWDIIFADPPYDFERYPELLELIIEKQLVNEGGYLIFEHDNQRSFDEHPNFLEMRKYGKVRFSFFNVSPSTE